MKTILDSLPKEEYYLDRQVAHHPDGFYIIIPNDYEKNTPLFCPVCDMMLRSRDDELAYIKFSCCDQCSAKWAYSRQQEWNSGWRPSVEDVIYEVKQRLPRIVSVDVD